MLFAPTIPRILVALVIFVALSFLRAGSWDGLGMGFIRIRFRFFHLFLMSFLGLRDFLRGRRGMDLRVLGICTLLLVGALVVSYAAACLLLALIP